MSVYKDKRGRKWLRVAETRSGIFAWFRPIQHVNDGYYDKSFKIADMVEVTT